MEDHGVESGETTLFLDGYVMSVKKDRIIGIGTILFALTNFFYLMPKYVGEFGMKETIFPVFTTSVLLLLGIILTISPFKKKGVKKPGNGDEEEAVEKRSVFKLLFTVLISFIYCFFLEKVGFIVLTPICLVATWLAFEVRSWKVIVFTTIILCVVIYMLFEFGLRAPLPQWDF